MTDTPIDLAALEAAIAADGRGAGALESAAGMGHGKLKQLRDGRARDVTTATLRGLAGALDMPMATLLGEDAGPARMIAHDMIGPVEQPRVAFDDAALDELADSILARGILQPLLLTGDYRIIAGERRWRAVRILIRRGQRAADWPLPCMIRENVDAEEHLVLSLIENLQREDLAPLEEAAAFADLADYHGWPVKRIAEACAKTPRWVEQRLALRRLGDAARAAMAEGLIGPAIARHIARLIDAQGAPDEPLQQGLVDRIRSGDMAATEDAVRGAVGALLSRRRADRDPGPTYPITEPGDDDADKNAPPLETLSPRGRGQGEGAPAGEPPSPDPDSGQPVDAFGLPEDPPPRVPTKMIHRDQIQVFRATYRPDEYPWPTHIEVRALGETGSDARAEYVRGDLVKAMYEPDEAEK